MTSMDTFLDSFENSEDYVFFRSDSELLHSAVKDGDYIVILKSSHPDFDVKENDNIIYIKDEGDLACSNVNYIRYIGSTKKFYTSYEGDKINFNPIYEPQVVGKVVKIVDNNFWNSMSIKIWDVSIHDLNLNALSPDD